MGHAAGLDDAARLATAMKLSIQAEQDATVIAVSGRLVHGEAVRNLHDSVETVVAQGANTIVVNLSDVAALDSSGLEALIAAYITCQKSGARLKVVEPNEKTRKILEVTKLDSLFGA